MKDKPADVVQLALVRLQALTAILMGQRDTLMQMGATFTKRGLPPTLTNAIADVRLKLAFLMEEVEGIWCQVKDYQEANPREGGKPPK